jgi:nitrate reductase gamma subunit
MSAIDVHTASPLLHFAEDKLQIIALTFMTLVYVLKIRWILSFKAGKERQAPTGDPSTTAKKGAVYSLFNIFMPWSMSSTRQHPFFYLQFGIFHVAVAILIAMSIIIPYFPELISGKIVIAGLQILFGLGFLVALGRLIRRIASPYIRAISTPDDIFSIAMLTVCFAFAFMAAPNNRHETEFWLLGYFLIIAFFLFYVPFSKISHYIFYPFTRWYLGKTLGHRGVYPLPFNPDNGPISKLFSRTKPVEGK